MGTCLLPNGAMGPAPTLTFRNGQPVTIGAVGGGLTQNYLQDHSRGYSFEFDLPSGENTYSISLDRSNHDSSQFELSPLFSINGYQLAPGSGQQFTTFAAKAEVALTPRLSVTFGDYFIDYKSHFSGDSGATFSDSANSFNAPRFALVTRPNPEPPCASVPARLLRRHT